MCAAWIEASGAWRLSPPEPRTAKAPTFLFFVAFFRGECREGCLADALDVTSSFAVAAHAGDDAKANAVSMTKLLKDLECMGALLLAGPAVLASAYNCLHGPERAKKRDRFSAWCEAAQAVAADVDPWS
jgi:hypothetical protein